MTTTARLSVDVACPFCGLICDDLVISTDSNGEITQCENACSRAEVAFRRACADTGNTVPTINQQPTKHADAIDHAAQMLTTATAPLIAGLATDVAGVRAAVRLAELTGAGLDHMNGRAIVRNQRVLQRTGWFTTTLTEIRNRADLVILIGEQVLENYPRLAERVLKPANALLPDRISNRRVVSINDDNAEQQSHSVPSAVDERINTRSTLDLLVDLRGRIDDNAQIEPLKHDVAELYDRIKASQYTVFIWAAGQLASDSGDLIIDTIGDIVRSINVESRAASLPVAGSNGDLTANQVCTWQTGLPLRMRFVDGEPQADLIGLDSADRIAAGDVDCLLWIDALTAETAPTGVDATIVLGHTSDSSAEVYIPVDTPGVGSDGLLVRADNVVTMPLRAIRAPRNQSVAEVLNDLCAAVVSLNQLKASSS